MLDQWFAQIFFFYINASSQEVWIRFIMRADDQVLKEILHYKHFCFDFSYQLNDLPLKYCFYELWDLSLALCILKTNYNFFINMKRHEVLLGFLSSLSIR